MTELKSTGRISPSERMWENIGNTFNMLHQAIRLFDFVWLQPPHWTREPTKEMLEAEALDVERMHDSKKEIERLAGEIYLSLTGQLCCKMPSLKWRSTPLMADGDLQRLNGTNPIGTSYCIWESEGFGIQINLCRNMDEGVHLGASKSIPEAKEFCEKHFHKIFREVFEV